MCSCSTLCFLLFFLLEQGKVLVQFGLNLLHPLICVFGGGVKLLLQQAQTDVGLTQLLALRERGAAMLITPPLFLILLSSKWADPFGTLDFSKKGRVFFV